METAAALTALDTLTATQYLDLFDNCARFDGCGPTELAYRDPAKLMRGIDVFSSEDLGHADPMHY